MTRLILCLVLLDLCSVAVAQDALGPGVPSGLIRVFEKAEADLRRNRQEYEEANQRTLAEFNKTVKKEVDRLSKAGKPEEALALKDSAEEWFQQALGGSAPDPALRMPANAEDKRKNPNGRVRLVDIKPSTIEGTAVVEENHDGVRPLINGQPTTEPFFYTRAPTKIAWQVPDGKKVFRSYVYYLGSRDANADHTAFMEVHADGKVIARSAVISVENRVAPIEVRIPPGTKTIVLVTDPHTHNVFDDCLWVSPSLYDR